MATQRLCSIPGCGKIHRSRGWCRPHYECWVRNGDALAGSATRTPSSELLRYFNETILAYEGDECLFWPFGKDSDGYGKMTDVAGKSERVHRLVCAEVNGPPPTPKHEAAHSCGNGHLACCTKGHLSWKTHAENMADKVMHGTGGLYRRRAA